MFNVCVYCASSSKVNSVYANAACKLGKLIAERGWRLVYGGGSVGLMGTLADSVLRANGKVIGIIPTFMVEAEWQHSGVTELIQTETIHERKALMASKSQAVIALPGGCGTMEELLEIITWKQLGIYKYPIIIVNINGYYNHLLKQLTQSAEEYFMRVQHLSLWSVVDDVDEIPAAIEKAGVVTEDLRQYAKI